MERNTRKSQDAGAGVGVDASKNSTGLQSNRRDTQNVELSVHTPSTTRSKVKGQSVNVMTRIAHEFRDDVVDINIENLAHEVEQESNRRKHAQNMSHIRTTSKKCERIHTTINRL